MKFKLMAVLLATALTGGLILADGRDSRPSIAQQLEDLASAYELGLLTEKEYQHKRTKLVFLLMR